MKLSPNKSIPSSSSAISSASSMSPIRSSASPRSSSSSASSSSLCGSGGGDDGIAVDPSVGSQGAKYQGLLGAGEDVGISSSSSLARFPRAVLLGPLFPADMLGLKGELRRCGQRMLFLEADSID